MVILEAGGGVEIEIVRGWQSLVMGRLEGVCL